MRTSLSLLVVLLAVSPAAGTVVVTCTDMRNWIGEIKYDASSEDQLVLAFALDITVDGPATIDSISGFVRGKSTAANPGYGYFPGNFSRYISIDPVTGEVTGWHDPSYTPVAEPSDPGALGGLGTNGITAELGSLYNFPQDAPLPAGKLFEIAINPHGGSEVNVHIALNAIRGGIVMEDASSPEVDLRGCTLVPEPATLVLLGLGGLALLRSRRKR
jgi:hypothetical protein